jgi:hypothetical protein
METCAPLFCSRIMERNHKEGDSRGVGSDCRTTPTCDGHQDFIWNLIGTFYHFMKSLPSLLLNGSNHILISSQSGPQSSSGWCCSHMFSGCLVVVSVNKGAI